MARLEELDLLKGIGILLVMVGHCSWTVPEITTLIYCFHMPLFIMASGVFFHRQNVVAMLKKSAKRLLVPWCFFVFINLSLALSLSFYATHDIKLSFIKVIASVSFGDSTCWILYRSIWFLIALFWIINFYNILSVIRNLAIRTLAVLTLFVLGSALSGRMQVPLFIDSAFSLIIYFHFGHLFGMQNKVNDLWKSNRQLCSVGGVIFVLFSIICIALSPTVNYKLNIAPLWLPVLAIPMIVSLFTICKGISATTYAQSLRHFLSVCSIYSIVILGLHRPIMEIYGIAMSKTPISNPNIQSLVYLTISIPLILFVSKVMHRRLPFLIGMKCQ